MRANIKGTSLIKLKPLSSVQGAIIVIGCGHHYLDLLSRVSHLRIALITHLFIMANQFSSSHSSLCFQVVRKMSGAVGMEYVCLRMLCAMVEKIVWTEVMRHLV